MAWTTADLLADVRLRAGLADTGGRLSASDLLAFGDHQIRTQIYPFLRQMRGDYLLYEEDVTLVDDQAEYDVPSRALGTALDDVLYIDSSGKAHSMPNISRSEVHRYSTGGSQQWPSSYAFALDATTLIVAPTPSNPSGSVRMRYMMRHGRLVETSRAAQVTTINSSDFVVDGAGAFGATGTVVVDCISQDPPFKTLSLDLSTSWDGTDTFTVTPPDGLAVGDWVTLAGESVVLQIPDAMHTVLGTAVVAQALRALGHHGEAAEYRGEFGQEMIAVREALSPRVASEAKVVINRGSMLRRNRRW